MRWILQEKNESRCNSERHWTNWIFISRVKEMSCRHTSHPQKERQEGDKEPEMRVNEKCQKGRVRGTQSGGPPFGTFCLLFACYEERRLFCSG